MPKKKRSKKVKIDKNKPRARGVHNSRISSSDIALGREFSADDDQFDEIFEQIPSEMSSFILYQAILDNMLQMFFEVKQNSCWRSVRSIINLLIEMEFDINCPLGKYGFNLTQLTFLFCDYDQIKKLIIERNAEIDIPYEDEFGLFSMHRDLLNAKKKDKANGSDFKLFDLLQYRIKSGYNKLSNADIVDIVMLLDEFSEQYIDFKNQKCKFIAQSIAEGCHEIPYFHYLTKKEYLSFECKIFQAKENNNKKEICRLGLFEFALLNGNLVSAVKLIPFVEMDKIGMFDSESVSRYLSLELELCFLSNYTPQIQKSSEFNIYDVFLFSVKQYNSLEIDEIKCIIEFFNQHKISPQRYASIELERFIKEIELEAEIGKQLQSIKLDEQKKPYVKQFELVELSGEEIPTKNTTSIYNCDNNIGPKGLSKPDPK